MNMINTAWDAAHKPPSSAPWVGGWPVLLLLFSLIRQDFPPNSLFPAELRSLVWAPASLCIPRLTPSARNSWFPDSVAFLFPDVMTAFFWASLRSCLPRGPSVPPITWGLAGNLDVGGPGACPEPCLCYVQVRVLRCTDAGFFRL